jgi:hypothetical protein
MPQDVRRRASASEASRVDGRVRTNRLEPASVTTVVGSDSLQDWGLFFVPFGNRGSRLLPLTRV